MNSADLQYLLFTLNTSLGNQVAAAAANAGAGAQCTAVQSKLARAGTAPLVQAVAATPPPARQHETSQTRSKRRH